MLPMPPSGRVSVLKFASKASLCEWRLHVSDDGALDRPHALVLGGFKCFFPLAWLGINAHKREGLGFKV